MMKKTLVALALAATTVSGSAMAWQANSTGGSLELGGTLTPQANVTPWEVLIGSAVNDINASIRAGNTSVDTVISKPITILGIRTQVSKTQTFAGSVGAALNPVIDFGGAINTSQFQNGVTPLSLDIRNSKDNATIGRLTVPMLAGAMASYDATADGGEKTFYSVYSDGQGGFMGGLSDKKAGALIDIRPRLNAINPDFSANFNEQGAGIHTSAPLGINFNNIAQYSGFYGAGIEAGQIMKLTLDAPATSDTIQWKASLPIVVSYQ
ncbi:hypothetical protein ABRC84_003723 [Salmonella enterica]